tara:strand:- start:62 stop:253 length:192 start_codon:yes stop_codon:yes gene_type:complete
MGSRGIFGGSLNKGEGGSSGSALKGTTTAPSGGGVRAGVRLETDGGVTVIRISPVFIIGSKRG